MLTGFFVGTLRVKAGLAQMLKGGIIMDVVNEAQAKTAEAAGVRNHLSGFVNVKY
jgi:pyridoxal biosynthesis lyase PdxS